VPRFFLRVRDGDTLLRDDEELQAFDTIGGARSEAIESAREILSQAVLIGKAASLRLQVEVVDEGGATVLIMPVGYAAGTESQT
jgi:uncharacterized protein DUF6894